MRRSPIYTSVALALGLTLALTLLWLLGGNLHTVRAATLTVTNTNDSGAGSLRQALIDAAPGDTINVTATDTILLTSGALTVTRSVTITGPGADLLAVDGNNAGRVISASADLSLSGLTIQNGNAPGTGGGINAAAALTLTNVNVISNTATNNGGGVYANSTLVMTDTQFISNTAQASGGAVWVADTITVSGGRFENNQALGNGGALLVGDTLILNNVQLANNTATNGGGAHIAGSGGGSRIVNTLFARNRVSGTGAALYIVSATDPVILHTTIASPTVGAGAAIYINAGTLDITDTIIAGYTTGIQQAGSSTVYQDYNLFYNTTPTAGTVGGGTHSFTGDPAFVNINTDDYHLTAASLAIDAGTKAGVTTDLDGNPRPIGNGYDIGAYELGSDLVIKKVASPEPAVAGTPLVYTITIANSGYPTPALGLVLSDTLPPSTTLGFTDQTDDDGAALGFGGGITQNIQWNDPRPAVHGDEWLGLVNSSLHTGVYTSRVMDATSVGTWNRLDWTPWRPYGKELPDFRQAETAYAMGNANMLGNDVLLHLNESTGATIFTDTSGLGHNSACPASAGETCPTAGVAGRFNGALHFDGALSNTVVITDATNPARYAIELWVRPTVVTDTSFILHTATVSGTALLPGPFSHLLGISGNRFLHLVSDSNGTHAITSTTVVTPGTWYHVVGLAQSNGEINLYVNGVEEAQSSGLGTLWTGGNQYRLGSSYGPYGSVTQYFTGDLDEVAVYSRTLSAAEITDHYVRGALRLSFQTRSCADAACAGSGGFASTLYSELNNTSLGLPSVTLTGVPNNRYFQYRATLTTDNSGYSPQLHDVRVGPDHYAVNVPSGQGSCAAPGASSFTCTLGSLAAGGVITVVVPVDLDPSALGVITNTASLTGTWTDGSVLSPTAMVTSTVIAQTDLRVVKEDDWYGGTDPVNPGSPMTYTLRVYNAGPSTAWSVRVTDTLPISVSSVITPTNWSCDYFRNVLTCTIASLLRHDWQDIIVTGNAPAIEGMITNTALITTATEISTTDNIDTQTTLVTPLADLSIAKSAYPDPVNPGETLTYTLVVTNSGPYTATNVVVTDTLQSGLIGRGFGAGWSCGLPGNVVICSLLYPLTPSQSASFNITVTAPLSGVLRNDAIVTSNTYDPDLYDPDTDNRVTTFAAARPVADLALSKSDAPDPVNAGTPLTYTITVTNAGPVPAGALTTTLSVANLHAIGIPGAVHGAAWPYPTTVYMDSMPGLVQNMTVTLTSLNHTFPGDLSILLVGPSRQSVVLMSNAGGGTHANGVTLTFNDAGAALPANDALTSTVVYRPTDYGIGGLPVPAPSGPYGGSLSTFNGASPNGVWELYVYDNVDSDGGSIAGWGLQLTTVTTDTVTLTDTLPSGLTGVGVSPAPGWAFNNNTGGVVTCMGSTLPVNVPTVFTIAATAPITGGIITNTAGITSTTADLRLADNTAAITTTVLAVADLQISKTASPNPVGAGQALTYTLTFTNAGPSPVANVTVIDTLPTNVTVGNVPVGCTPGGNTITCTVAILPVNIPTNLSFTVLAPPNAGGITNTAGITATVIDTNTLNNTAWVTTTVTPSADLSIVKTATPNPVWPGGIITYTLVVSNNGPSVATNVILTDSIPASTTFRSISPAGWNCTTPAIGGTGNIICTNPSLAASTPSIFTIAVQVDADTPSGAAIANTATVSSDTADPTTPNTATAVTTVSLYKLYLPVVMRNYAVAPDLIVSSLVVTSTGVQVVIKNQGDAPIAQVITQEFWVDLYVNPTPPPTGVNQIWKDGRSAHGIVWGVTTDALPLAPGGTITLTAGGAYYRSDLSEMAWPLPVGTVIYAQVDSANTLTNYGAVLENHEITGGTYNNITHTTSIAGVMGETRQAPVTEDRPSDFSDHLPPRP